MTTFKINNSLPFLIENYLVNQKEQTLQKANFKSFPFVNAYETNDAIHLDIAAPGLLKTDFKINFQKKQLTISANSETIEDENIKFTRKEFDFKNFQRTFTLPDFIDNEKIEANYSNGILKISLPKIEQAKEKEAREIKIS